MSQPSRKLRGFVTLSAGLAALLLVGGCQSTARDDLIARERRRQEDQIYALQAYLDEYQQLVCQYRAENEALKEQLGSPTDSNNNDGTLRPPAPPRTETRPPRAPVSTPDRNTAPIEVPDLDVPPLTVPNPGDGKSSRRPLRSRVGPVAYEMDDPIEEIGPPSVLWMSGEILANDSGGPRVLIDIAALSAAGRSTTFDGAVSLMILKPQSAGEPLNLARWDFSPEDVQHARDDAPDPHAARFRVELPADVTLGGPVELWARLLPVSGEKMLAKVPIDLREPRTFASVPFETSPKRFDVTPALAEHSDASFVDIYIDQTPVPATQDGWAVARPGQTARPPVASRPSNDWRASSEPMPVAVVASPVVGPTPSATVASDPPALGSLAPPIWSPERTSGSSASPTRRATVAVKAPTTPDNWSPTR